jgi:hypothetical protein
MPTWGSTPLKKRKFIEHLARTGRVGEAAEASGLSRNHYQNLRKSDPEFAAACAEAMEQAIDALESEAWTRAVEGELQYVVSAGKLVLGPDNQPLMRRRKSDQLLLALLRAHSPKFAERRGEQLADLRIKQHTRTSEEITAEVKRKLSIVLGLEEGA